MSKEVVITFKDLAIPEVYAEYGKPVDNVKGVPCDSLTWCGTYVRRGSKWEVHNAVLPAPNEIFEVLFESTNEVIEDILKDDPSAFLSEPVKLEDGNILRNDLLVKVTDVIYELPMYVHPIYNENGEETGDYVHLACYTVG